MRILEIGPGCGNYRFNARVHGLGVVYIDLEKPETKDVEEWIQCDIDYGLPFHDNSFDTVHMHHVLEHLEDPLKALKEIHRILRCGGRLYVSVPNKWHSTAYMDPGHKNIFSLGMLWRLCRKAGFYVRQYNYVSLGDHVPFRSIIEKIINRLLPELSLECTKRC